MHFKLPRGLYFVADTGVLARSQIMPVTRSALLGGAALVQLRAKDLDPGGMIELARELIRLCGEFGVPLLVNDLPDVAAASGAAGVHLGQDDALVAQARELLGPEVIIGVTTPTVEAVRRAETEGADYVSAGPMFASPTKPEKPVAGPDLARRLRRETTLPLCAIGGITAGNVVELAGCGVDLVCVISAIARADDPRAATKEIIEAMRAADLATDQRE